MDRIPDDTKAVEPTEGGRLPVDLHVQLTVLEGPDKGMVKKLWKTETVLGRGEDADIRIEDPAASKRHTLLLYDGINILLRDLESKNGTMLNGGRVWEAVLKNLDEITIGQTVMQVSILRETGAQEDDSRVEVISAEEDTETTRTQRAARERDPLSEELPAQVRSFLQVAVGPDAGLRFEIKKKAVVIGRSEADADFALHDADVSRKHASIEFLGKDKVILKDLRSKNGTYLNQHRISVASLKHGDAIQLGATTLNFFVSFGGQGGKSP